MAKFRVTIEYDTTDTETMRALRPLFASDKLSFKVARVLGPRGPKKLYDIYYDKLLIHKSVREEAAVTFIKYKKDPKYTMVKV